MSDPLPSLTSLTNHLSSHLQSLTSIYSQLSPSPAPAIQSHLDALTSLIHSTTSSQLSAASTLLLTTKETLEKEWKKVDGWKNALGEPASTRRSFGQTGVEPLEVQLEQVESILGKMRGRMEERGTRIMGLIAKLNAVGDIMNGEGGEEDSVRVELEDISEGWEGLDLRLDRMSALERELVRCDAEIASRKSLIHTHTTEIFALRSELGVHDTSDPFDEIILCHLGIGEGRVQKGMEARVENVRRLEAKRAWLEEEKNSRNSTIQTTYDKLYPLWTMLGVSETEMEDFVNRWMGSTMDVVNAYQTELTRMLTLKRSNLSSFILSERLLLVQLWDALYLSPQQRLASFPPYSIDVAPTVVWNAVNGCEEELVNENVSEELLVAHERERERLEGVKEGLMGVLGRLEKYFGVVGEMAELEASASDPSRLLGKSTRGDPGRLLREEKARKRVAKEKPKLEAELRTIIPQWEQDNGRPFLVNGKRFLDELDEKIEREIAEKESKKRSKTPTARNTTAPLRSQPTGGSTVPIKRQMTGSSTASARTGTGPLKRQTTGVLGEVGNRVVPQHTGVGRLQAQQTGTGMKLPPGWAVGAQTPNDGKTYPPPQSQQATMGMQQGFRPRGSVTSSVGGSSAGSGMTGMGWPQGGH